MASEASKEDVAKQDRSFSHKYSLKRFAPVILTILLGGTLSIGLFVRARDAERHELQDEFEHTADNCSSVIISSIKTKLLLLESIRSFYHGSQNVESDEFAAFIKPYIGDLNGIHAFQWVPMVRQEERQEFEDNVRKSGIERFIISECTKDGQIISAKQRDEYYPVNFTEPYNNNLDIGYDLASDPSLLKSMNLAIESGNIVASEHVRLIDLLNNQFGIYVFVPVYKNDIIPDEKVARRTEIEGLIVEVLHVDELVESSLLNMHNKPIEIHILDNSAKGTKLLYTHSSHGPDNNDHSISRFKHDRFSSNIRSATKVIIGQREWVISCNPENGFVSPDKASHSFMILAFGVFTTLLVSIYFLNNIGRTERIERLVTERTGQLSSANELLQHEMSRREEAQAEMEKLLTLISISNNDLIKSNEKLERSNKELEDFAYIASHDLQEPLRKVIAFGDRLKSKYSEVLDETGIDYLGRMRNAAERMSALINDLLTYSRLTSKARSFEDVDLEEITQEVLSDMEIRVEELGATVEVGSLCGLKADKIQMRQLIQNLISNALKFHNPEEAPKVKIFCRSLPHEVNENAESEVLQIVVEDNGIGFDEKYRERIFGMFQRLHGRGEYEGTGLGLAVCRKIADRHDIAIEVNSTPGKGTKFILTPEPGNILSKSTETC